MGKCPASLRSPSAPCSSSAPPTCWPAASPSACARWSRAPACRRWPSTPTSTAWPVCGPRCGVRGSSGSATGSRRSRPPTTPVHDLAALGAAYQRNAAEHPALYRAMFDAAYDLADPTVASTAFDLLVDAAARARDQGRFAPEADPLGVATRYWASGHGLAMLGLTGVLPLEVVRRRGPRGRGRALRPRRGPARPRPALGQRGLGSAGDPSARRRGRTRRPRPGARRGPAAAAPPGGRRSPAR